MPKLITDSHINRITNSPAELNYPNKKIEDFIAYKLTNKSNPFADCGAWFGYYFNDDQTLSFNGPNLISQEIPVNAAKNITQTYLVINNKTFNQFKDITFIEANGRLIIKAKITTKDYVVSITKSLIFVNSEDALVTLELEAHSKIDLNIKLYNQSIVYQEVNYDSSENKNDWVAYFKEHKVNKTSIDYCFNPLVNKAVNETLRVSYNTKITQCSETTQDNTNVLQYQFDEINIAKHQKSKTIIHWYESYFFNKKKNPISFDETTIEALIADHDARWLKYKKFANKHNPKEANILYKCIVTLITNWLAPNGQLLSDIVIPSRTYKDFIGAYAWDTYKIAYGISYFDVTLAKKIISGSFAHQITKKDTVRPQDAGMVPDAIFYNFASDRNGVGENWNERNTKPPLALWSVWNVYQKSKDISFLKKLYPQMKLYLDWWINSRRLNQSYYLLCYGATKHKQNNIKDEQSIVTAASWESGMDNAPRFDWDRMKVITKKNQQNETVGYIINQSSICLNSFFYNELKTFVKIAKLLKQDQDIKYYNDYAIGLKKNINQFMFSDNDKFFHDINSESMQPLDQYGLSIESFIPLYAMASDSDLKVKECLSYLNEQNFLTKFPFPTVAINNDRFNEYNYWRGPVWISFQYFATKGIYNYNKSLAQKIYKQIINTLNSKQHFNNPLRENYSPISGIGLATTNFSWTAAMFIALITEIGG